VSVEMTTTLRVQRIFAKPLSVLLPKARVVPGVNREWICRDPDFMEDFDNDPLNFAGEMTSRMGEQSLSAMAELQNDTRVENADSSFCEVPILLMMGSNDKVTSLPVAKEFFNRIANRDKEFKVFEGPYHALFDDLDKDQVFDHLIEWLHLRFPESASVTTVVATKNEEVEAPEEAALEKEVAPAPVSMDEVTVDAVVEASAVTEEKTAEVKVEATEVEASAAKVEVVEGQVVTEQKTEEVNVVQETAVEVVQTKLKVEVDAAEVKTEVVLTTESAVAPTEPQPASAPQL